MNRFGGVVVCVLHNEPNRPRVKLRLGPPSGGPPRPRVADLTVSAFAPVQYYVDGLL